MSERRTALEEWHIRPILPGEEPLLSDIYMQVRRATFTWIDRERFTREDFLKDSRGERVFVCCDDAGRIAGFMSLWEIEHFIHMLYVLPAFQGKGVGHALLGGLPEWPNRRYRLKCLVNNARALRFYKSIGFKITGDGWSADGQYKDMIFDPRPVVQR